MKVIVLLTSIAVLGCLIYIIQHREKVEWFSVLRELGEFRLVKGKMRPDSLAWGSYQDEIFKDGWGKLTIHTNSFKHPDEAYAAGYLEGSLQQKYIYHHKINFFEQIFEEKVVPDQELKDFLLAQYDYTNSQVASNPDSEYWQSVGLFMKYFEGMVLGYNMKSPLSKQLTKMDFLILQVMGDWGDLNRALHPSTTDWESITPEQFRRSFLLGNHCTVMLKIKEDLSDVFLGHNTWTAGQSLLRTYKFYYFGDDLNIQFSGYPGVVFSNDDYYVLTTQHQQLFVTETTNHVSDETIFKHVTPKSLFTWQRAMVANHLATDGQQWTEIFKAENSGTYNNQYMIVDAKKFSEGKGASPGFLWIVEQMPGMIVQPNLHWQISRDVTDVIVGLGYWPSFNIPYFQEIYEYSGQAKAAEKVGTEMTYQGAPRYQILKREVVHIQTLDDYKRLTRHNKFRTDEFSKGDPTWTLASRADLYDDPDKRVTFFATDAKVTTWSRIVYENGSLVTDAQSGPTHDDQPVFVWSETNFTAYHYGQPDVWDFGWVTLSPSE